MLCVRRLCVNLRHLHTTTTVYRGPSKYTEWQAIKLQKKTGFTIIKCRNALEMFGNTREAEQWLLEQMWSNDIRKQDGSMTQGLIGICAEGNKAAMVEVNCESDAVVKNPQFQNLVSQVVKTCLSTASNQPGEHLYMNQFNQLQEKTLNQTDQVDQLQEETHSETDQIDQLQEETHSQTEQIDQLQEKTISQTLVDLVALQIGNIGENMSVKRACVLHALEGQKIGVYCHGDVPQQAKEIKIGKYGALVLFTGYSGSSNEQLGHNLAMHIVARNPLTVGWLKIPEPVMRQKYKSVRRKFRKRYQRYLNLLRKLQPKEYEEDETMLLRQKYLAYEEITIAELLFENSATVESFVRYQCEDPL